MITDLHDFALIFLNGKFIGTIDRRVGQNTIDLPKSDAKTPVLEILIEAMGRINYSQNLIDRKGITDRVTLNGMTLMNWEVYNIPFDSGKIKAVKKSAVHPDRRGFFFKGSFNLKNRGDTYLDLSGYKKGIIFVNGHNLGRFWEIGPQKRLFCPAPWLLKGENEIVVFDLLQTEAKSVVGYRTLIN